MSGEPNIAQELPPSLAPWATLLAIFPHEVALAIAPLVQRLDAAIGSLRHNFRSSGEPDGFDGVSRRGSYERLLLSEWLLAEEIPDEFIRRAATGEHAFLQIARREPAAARACVALFDAGPNQIGAPRLAQIAALVVLARRALATGTPFFWGVLQKPQNALAENVTPQNVDGLLAARSAQEAGTKELHNWKYRLHMQAETRENASVWIVGGRRLRALGLVEAFDNAPLSDAGNRTATATATRARIFALASTRGGAASLENITLGADANFAALAPSSALATRQNDAATRGEETNLRFSRSLATTQTASTRGLVPASFLELHDEIDSVPRVLATVWEHGVALREVALALPPSAMQARLLRDPFATAAQAASERKVPGIAPVPQSNLIFANSGQKLLARGEHNTLLAYPLPNSPRAGIGATKTHRAHSSAQTFAANRFGRDLVTVGLHRLGDVKLVRVESGTNTLLNLGDCAVPENFKIEEGAPMLRECALLPPLRPALFFIDDARNLWGITHNDKSAQISWQATDTLAMTMSGGNIFYIARPSPNTRKWQIVRLAQGVNPAAPRKIEDENLGGCEQTIVGVPQVQSTIEDETVRAAFFGFGGELAHPDYGLVAYQREDYRWIILYLGGALHLETPASTQVIGVVALPGKNSLPALVVLEKDRRSISLLSRNWSQTLKMGDEAAAPVGTPHETASGEIATRATSPIVNACVSTQAPIVAYTTKAAEIVAYSLVREATLMRLQTKP